MAASIKDVASAAGVGIGTVSRVINGEDAVSEKTRQKVLHAVRELDYRSNSMGARLRRNQSKLVALLVPLIDHPFFARFAYALEGELDKMGYSMLVVSSQRREARELEVLDKLKHREVDGVVFITHFAHEGISFDDLPIVSVDRHLGERTPYVTTDNYDASARAVEYLFARGCRRIAYMGGRPAVASEVGERLRGYADTVKKLGMPERAYYETIHHGEEYAAAEAFLRRYGDCDGVFVSGDIMAQALYNACYARSVTVPGEMQIVSFDGALSEWNYGSTLSCVVQPIDAMAARAAHLVIDRIEKKACPVRNVIASRFVPGDSTK